MADKKNPESDGRDEGIEEAGQKAWREKVESFAKITGLGPENVEKAFVGLVGEPGDESAELLGDPNCTTDEMLEEAFPGVPRARLRKAARAMWGSDGRAVLAPYGSSQLAPVGQTAQYVETSLPEPLAESSFLDACRTGGVAKLPAIDVVAAVRSYMAVRYGVYNLPRKLLDLMHKHSMEMQEPCSSEFFSVEKMLNRRRFGYILDSEKADRISVSEREKKILMSRMRPLFPEVFAFHKSVVAWVEEWRQQSMVNGVISGPWTGGACPPFPPPNTSPLVDAAGRVIDVANWVFAGKGVITARVMAADSIEIRKLLEVPNLPMHVGASNHEEMLRRLNAGLSQEDIRQVNDLSVYILAVYKIPEYSSAQLRDYFVKLHQLGMSINWAKLCEGLPEPETSEVDGDGEIFGGGEDYAPDAAPSASSSNRAVVKPRTARVGRF